jgi:hypothetical protein
MKSVTLAMPVVQECAVGMPTPQEVTLAMRTWGTEDDPPTAIVISAVTFDAARERISINFITTLDCSCIIRGREHGEVAFSNWITVPNLHSSPHSHLKRNLNASTEYDIRIFCQTAGGPTAWYPSDSSWCVVKTDDVHGAGGGYERVEP